MKKKPELLAPAGNMECLKTALYFGADAVYLAGRSFGLRAHAANFSLPEIAQAVRAAHAASRKVYVAVNALLYEEELAPLRTYLEQLNETNADGLIFSDPSVLALHRSSGLTIPLHVSTQASVLNSAAASFWHAQGAERVILGREVSLTQLARIRANTPHDLSLEVFVHGAMCIAHSGRCLLSSVFTGRSANKGACAQPCRWEYEIREKGSGDDFCEIDEDARGTYILNSRDLMMLDRIGDLCDAGADSLKIEGRMKSTYYVASVVHAYRRAIDLWYEQGKNAPPELLDELAKSATRLYTRGFFYGDPHADTIDTVREEVPRRYTFVARVLGTTPDGYIRVEQRNKFREGEMLEVLSPRTEGVRFVCEGLRTPDGEKRESAPHAQEHLLMRCSVPLHEGDLLRREDAEAGTGT